MYRLPALLMRLKADDSGSTATEYAVMAMVIAVALVTAFTALGTNISNMWNSVAGDITKASGS